MRYYTPGDDIYFFGFSRGAYTARFLAEMLDHVGLLSVSGRWIPTYPIHTNLVEGRQRGDVSFRLEVSPRSFGLPSVTDSPRRTFQKWQCRVPEKKQLAEGEKSEKQKLLEFMCAFRETFSRPVKPIRFLGLFDTVNSVPAFENAWMRRSKFPYTARSSARVIRHAVSLDERRAKFRQDLISQERPDRSHYYKGHGRHRRMIDVGQGTRDDTDNEKSGDEDAERGRNGTLAPPERFSNPHETSGVRSRSPGYSSAVSTRSGACSVRTFDAHEIWNMTEEDEGEQDIQEVWFPGCHAVSVIVAAA